MPVALRERSPLLQYLEESIRGTQWCVFEPNDERLWGRIRRTISAFLVNEWRSGALFGEKAGQAFFVKCDGENTAEASMPAWSSSGKVAP